MAYSYTFQNEGLTVSELIHALNQYDQDAKVIFDKGLILYRLHDKSEDVTFEFNLVELDSSQEENH